MTTTTLDAFVGGLDFGDIEITSDDLYGSSNTLTLRRGVPTACKVEVNGQSLDAEITFNAGRLTRVVVFENTYRDRDENYLQVSGVINNVNMKIRVNIGGQWLEMTELLFQIYQAKTADNAVLNQETFAARLNSLGFRYSGDATIAWNHFGVDPGDLAEIVNVLQGHGAFEDIGSVPEERRGRMQHIWKFPEGHGLDLESIEVGSTDRNESRTGQGFLNFVDAGVSSLIKMLQLKTQASRLSAEAEKAEDEDARTLLTAQATHVNRMATSWVSNLAGRQQRLQVDEGTGAIVEVGDNMVNSDVQIDPVNVGIGRFGYVSEIDPQDEPVVATLDFWQRRTAAPAVPTVEEIVDPETEELDDGTF